MEASTSQHNGVTEDLPRPCGSQGSRTPLPGFAPWLRMGDRVAIHGRGDRLREGCVADNEESI